MAIRLENWFINNNTIAGYIQYPEPKYICKRKVISVHGTTVITPDNRPEIKLGKSSSMNYKRDMIVDGNTWNVIPLPNPMSRSRAKEYLQATGYRLPSIEELMTLVIYRGEGHNLYFENKEIPIDRMYWTDSFKKGKGYRAVDFKHGTTRFFQNKIPLYAIGVK